MKLFNVSYYRKPITLILCPDGVPWFFVSDFSDNASEAIHELDEFFFGDTEHMKHPGDTLLAESVVSGWGLLVWAVLSQNSNLFEWLVSQILPGIYGGSKISEDVLISRFERLQFPPLERGNKACNLE